MPQVVLNINDDAIVTLTHKMEQLSRSAFPVAVRSTLNDAAFDVKRRTLELSADAHFIRRSPTFFKRFSGVNLAKGFNVDGMTSEVGLTSLGQTTAQSAIANMTEQEVGGEVIGGLDYLKAARSGSNLRRVAKQNYFKAGNVLNGAYRRPGTAKSNRVASAYAALATGKLMKFKSNAGQVYYAQVLSIQTNRKSGRLIIKSKLMLEGRKSVNIKATHFMRTAALLTEKRIADFYRVQATKQLERLGWN